MAHTWGRHLASMWGQQRHRLSSASQPASQSALGKERYDSWAEATRWPAGQQHHWPNASCQLEGARPVQGSTRLMLLMRDGAPPDAWEMSAATTVTRVQARGHTAVTGRVRITFACASSKWPVSFWRTHASCLAHIWRRGSTRAALARLESGFSGQWNWTLLLVAVAVSCSPTCTHTGTSANWTDLSLERERERERLESEFGGAFANKRATSEHPSATSNQTHETTTIFVIVLFFSSFPRFCVTI